MFTGQKNDAASFGGHPDFEEKSNTQLEQFSDMLKAFENGGGEKEFLSQSPSSCI